MWESVKWWKCENTETHTPLECQGVELEASGCVHTFIFLGRPNQFNIFRFSNYYFVFFSLRSPNQGKAGLHRLQQKDTVLTLFFFLVHKFPWGSCVRTDSHKDHVLSVFGFLKIFFTPLVSLITAVIFTLKVTFGQKQSLMWCPTLAVLPKLECVILT